MALTIQSPGRWGSKIPSGIDLAGLSWGQYMAKRLVRFKGGRQGEGPSWEGRGEEIGGVSAGIPLTERGYWQGRYVLCELTLEKGDGGRLTLADAVVAVSRERRIVSTAMTGRDGTVKEYVNEGDWELNIVVGLQHLEDGKIADEWPGDELRELRGYLEDKGALRVQSAFLDVFGISRIVVRSHSVGQMTEANYQVVNIGAVSDDEVEIYSNDY